MEKGRGGDKRNTQGRRRRRGVMEETHKGNVLFVQGQYSEAIKLYTKALKDHASPVLLWYDTII